MLTSRYVVFILLAGLGLLYPAALLGQAGPFSGPGELKLAELAMGIRAGSSLVPVATTDNRTQDPTLRYARLLPVE